MNQIGRVSTNLRISFFAVYKDGLVFIERGALFHNLVESFWNVHSAMVDEPSSTSYPLHHDTPHDWNFNIPQK